MPHLMIVSAAGTSQRRLVSDTVASEGEMGYSLSSRREGGAWNDLLSSENGVGLFEPKRLVLVEEAQELGKFPLGMESLLEGPESCTHILLVYSDEPRSLFEKGIHARLAWLKGEDIPRFGTARQRWVESKAGGLGLSFSLEAMGLLLDTVEDPEEMLSELKKLKEFPRGNPIGIEDVRTLCFDEGEKALLQLLDGLCEADRNKVVESFRHVRRRDLIPVVAALHNRFRLALYRSCLTSSRSRKSAGEALKARPYQDRQAEQATRHYSREALSALIRDLCAVNIGEKTGNRGGWVKLEMILLDFLASSRHRATKKA